jgi:anaerobic ribonucleoside-triphosphate reductase activating protein
MKLFQIQWPVTNPYQKVAVELYFSGCTRKCEGCHNSQLADFSLGEELTETKLKEVLAYLEERRDFFDIISFTGGDLVCHPLEESLPIVIRIVSKFRNKIIWLFTGEEKLRNISPKLLLYFDVVKTGYYDKTKLTNSFPASSNQKVNYKGKDYL